MAKSDFKGRPDLLERCTECTLFDERLGKNCADFKICEKENKQWQIAERMTQYTKELFEACIIAERALKDIMGAADNKQPYSPEELMAEFIDDYNAIHSAIIKVNPDYEG